MFLIFGPNSTYFFDDRHGTRKWRAWPAFDKYMSSRQIGEISNIAFGEDEAFFICHAEGGGGTGLASTKAWRNYMDDPRGRYEKFEKWCFHEGVGHERSTVGVNFGAGGAFWGWSGQGHRWRNAPEGLMDYYQKFTRVDLYMKSRINTVDMGHNGTYLGIGVDNTWFWSLGDEYTELSRLLGRKGVDSIQWISINPFAPQQHFVAFADGSIHWALPAHWIQDMQSVIRKLAVQRGARVPQSPPAYSPTAQTDPFANFAAQVNASLPRPSPPTLPPRRTGRLSSFLSGSSTQQQQQQPTTPAANLYQQYFQSSTSTSPLANPYSNLAPQYPQPAAFDWTQYMQSTQDILNIYNNTFAQTQAQLAAAQAQAYQPYAYQQPSTGETVASGIDTVNNGIQIVNSLTDTGNMLGQFVVQGAGAAAACCVM